MKHRLTVLFAAALVAALPGSSAVAHAAAPSAEYVPFVTDFPTPAAAGAPAASGSDWSGLGIGSAAGVGLVALLAGSGLVLARRARPA